MKGHRTLSQEAKEVGVGAQSIFSCFEWSRTGGVEGLLTRQPRGKGWATWLDAQSAKALLEKLGKGGGPKTSISGWKKTPKAALPRRNPQILGKG